MLQELEHMEVVRHAIVLHDTPPLRLVLRHDTIGVVEGALGQWLRFAPSHILGALGAKHTRWDAKPNAPINTALPPVIVLAVFMEHMDFITEKGGAAVMGMRHERFVRVEFQMEFIAEKSGESLLDDNCFTFRTTEPQQEIISVADVPEAAEVGIVGIARRDTLRLLTKYPCALPLSLLPGL
jgi:hypothetical protein